MGERVKHVIERRYYAVKIEKWEVYLQEGDDPQHAINEHFDAFLEDVTSQGHLVSTAIADLVIEQQDNELSVVEPDSAKVIPMRRP